LNSPNAVPYVVIVVIIGPHRSVLTTRVPLSVCPCVCW